MGVISDKFKQYTKYGATDFLSNINTVWGNLRGLLLDFRTKTYTAIDELESGKVDKIKNENNIKIVQGVPVGGQNEFLVSSIGYLKIKLPTFNSNIPFSLELNFRDLGSAKKTSKYLIKGLITNPIGTENEVILVKSSTEDFVFDFCKGATEDYIIVRKADNSTTNWAFRSFVINNVTYRGSVDWSTGWDISFVTTLETLDATKKVTVTPSLNATHINGFGTTTEGEVSKVPVLDQNGGLVIGSKWATGYNAKRYTDFYLGFTTDQKSSLILLTPVRLTGNVGASLIVGDFTFDRGHDDSFLINGKLEIGIKTAYAENKITKFIDQFSSVNLDGENLLKLCTAIYKGVTYYAIKVPSWSALGITFNGRFKTTSAEIVKPTLLKNYTTNTDVTTVTEIDHSSNITKSFIRRVIGSVVDYMLIQSLTIKKSSTVALDVENDAGKTIFKVDTVTGKVTQVLPTTTTPVNNGELEIQATSNTQLTLKYKGTDGVVRSGNITLS